MSARRKHAGKRRSARPKKNPSKTGSPAAPPRRESSTQVSAGRALDECIGAVSLVDVAMNSLESQDIASPEQEVLKRALKAIWSVHDWIYELTPDVFADEDTDRGDES